jgi:serine/threonine protein kinase
MSGGDVSEIYELGARIGKGSFGDVYHGVIKATGETIHQRKERAS